MKDKISNEFFIERLTNNVDDLITTTTTTTKTKTDLVNRLIIGDNATSLSLTASSSSSTSSSSSSSSATGSTNALNIVEANNLNNNPNENLIIEESSSRFKIVGRNLNENELMAVDEFLRRKNWQSDNARNWNIAVKFLMARKFDVERAVKLYDDHENLRKKESLHLINLNDEAFNRDLESGKFTILPFIKNYPICALFTVKLHSCTNTVDELITLKTLIYQLDAALENPETQRNGINFIYDMNNCKRANYDISLSRKILTLVRGSYPARLNKLYVVAAPFWFKLVAKVLGILMRDKIRERVVFVTNDELKNQIPNDILPDYLGGQLKLNHKNWLTECNKLITNKSSTAYTYYYESTHHPENILAGKTTSKSGEEAQLSSNSSSSISNNVDELDTDNSSMKPNELLANRKRNLSESVVETENKKQIIQQQLLQVNGKNDESPQQIISNSVDERFLSNNFEEEDDEENREFIDDFNEKIEPLAFDEFYESIQNVDQSKDNGMTIEQLIEHTINTGAYGLSEEFKNIRSQPIYSSFDCFKDRENIFKNRYRDVICLDDSRVKLETGSLSNCGGCELGQNLKNLPRGGDYVHANFVDGYRQKNAYISTQGPLDETVADFWQMIWQQFVLVIAMTTKVVEQRKIKCAQYWPAVEGESFNIQDFFEIKNCGVDDLDDYKVTKLSIKHIPTQQTRNIVHCQFMSWPDHGVPGTAANILEFIEIVRRNQQECLKELNSSNLKLKWTKHPLGPPICVHCSAGIGRTGTFCAIDISINRIKDIHTVDIEDTVNKIRLQRAQSVQMRDQYVFCYMAVLEYAQREKLFEPGSVDLAQLFNLLL